MNLTAFFLAVLCGVLPASCGDGGNNNSQSAGVEWDVLVQEASDLYRAGKYDRAVVVSQKALQVAEESVGPDHPSVAQSLHNLAELYRTQGDYAKAEPLHKRALAIREKALGPDHPDVAESLESLAALYRETKRFTEAERFEVRAKEIRAIQR
jgi:tetratricopeptide (TPR) repeat protein